MNASSLELWGGVECTVNRVGNQFFDQMERNGHAWRDDDLERFAALGLKALRYPLLWERLAPEHALVSDWSWADRRLNRLRELGIRPIVGLVHHGSGPRRTHLLDPKFAEGLARFARQVAERYPWVEDYTPVNEPLTTARFSALYGHWYPHARDDHSFARAFVNQCHAVVLSMRAVRSVNPVARLVQTEDLGKTFSTSALADQAEFENQRRWLTFDLLSGHLNRQHPLWPYLHEVGISSRELGCFLDQPCPPDILGINHYITSERFLDERLERYPAYALAGSSERPYADMPAVRASAQGVSGPGRLLREAWERYHVPLVVTEAQLKCTREEQMRWFTEIWRDADALRRHEGVDVRAVTLWALLGAFNWTNLLTRDDPDSYEPGAFDLRAPEPRPTALAALARTLARDGDTDHPVLRASGWWKRADRFTCEPAEAHQPLAPTVFQKESSADPASFPLLVIGKDRALAQAFHVACLGRALSIEVLNPSGLETTDLTTIRGLLDSVKPWAVVHSPDEVGESIGLTPHVLAQAGAERGVPVLILPPGQEHTAETGGATRASVVADHPSALVVRTGIRFGPWDHTDRVSAAARAPATAKTSPLPEGRLFALTYLPDLVQACLDLLLDGAPGVWDLSNAGTLDLTMFNACASEILSPTPEPTMGVRSEIVPPLQANEICIQSAALLPSWQSALRHLIHTQPPS